MSDVTAVTGSGSEPQASSDGDLRTGDVVGEFVIEAKLGKGAFGTVYKAANEIGKPAAVKVLARKYSVDPEIVERFITEARAVNEIRHKNIIDIFSFGELPDGRWYYVMEYLDGETLDAVLKRRPLTLAEAIPILRAVARAIDAAHAKGIAHRDLKPENVLLATDDEGRVFPKLLDFGVAKLLGPHDALKHKTRTGAPIGTPYYMSPEQCRGKGVDHRTDFYAFGVMTYQLLTGQYPIDGEDYMTILMQQISHTPPPPSVHVPELTEAVDAAVLWLMAKDPAARPPDLATAVRALTDASAKAGVFVPKSLTPTSPPLSPVPATRSRAPVALLAMTIIAIAAVAMFVAMRESDRPAPSVQARSSPPQQAPVVEATPMPPNVIITITDTPLGATVRANTQELGLAPGAIELPRGTSPVSLVVSAPAYQPSSVSITPDRNQTISIALKPIAKPVTPPSKQPKNPREELANPFRRSH